MTHEPPRPSLWRSVFEDLDTDAPSKAADHAFHPGYVQARSDLAHSPWKITGEGDTARARMFIDQGVAKLKDPHYRFSVGELFSDLPPEARRSLERLDDDQGNSYLSLPRAHYATSVEPIIRMHDFDFLGTIATEGIIDAVPSYTLPSDRTLPWEQGHGQPLELREGYYKGRNELVAGEWKATAQGNRIRTIKGAAAFLQDPAYKLGLEHAILGLGRNTGGPTLLDPDHYKIVTLDNDITVTVKEGYYQAHISPFVVRPGEYMLQEGSIDYDALSRGHTPPHKSAGDDTTVSHSLLLRRVKHDIFSAKEKDWVRDERSADVPIVTVTLPVRTNHDAYIETAQQFLRTHYASTAQAPFMEVARNGNTVTVSLAASCHTALQRDAAAYQQQKQQGRA